MYVSQYLTFISSLEGANVYSQTGWGPWPDLPSGSATGVSPSRHLWTTVVDKGDALESKEPAQEPIWSNFRATVINQAVKFCHYVTLVTATI